MSSTEACIYSVSALSSGLILVYISECLLDLTEVKLTPIFFVVLLKSGMRLNTPIEPVRVPAFEKILSQLFEIQYPPDAA